AKGLVYSEVEKNLHGKRNGLSVVNFTYPTAILMKFIRLLLLVFLCCSASSSCKTNKTYHNDRKEFGALKDGLKVGNWKYFHENGRLYQQGRFADGKETGHWRIYHPNGNLWQEGKFKGGRQNGRWIFFYDDGTLQGKGRLNRGQYA